MYVRAQYRRRGIGTALVKTLVEHCEARSVVAIELWTAKDGPGRSLYTKAGFRAVGTKGPGFENAPDRPDEIRMRLDLTDKTARDIA
jgi:GNAT superfamily N-acetyltransferase